MVEQLVRIEKLLFFSHKHVNFFLLNNKSKNIQIPNNEYLLQKLVNAIMMITPSQYAQSYH
jgi:hypothetical protein